MIPILRIIAVDDEPLALRRLELLLRDMDDVELVATARTPAEAERLIEASSPDVVLLDVELGGATGFDLLERMGRERGPSIVFVTAFSDHAVRAFDRESVDYVLKPVEPSRLNAALDRVRRRRRMDQAAPRTGGEGVGAGTEGAAPAPSDRFETEFWIRSRSGDLVRIPVDDIVSASSEDDYVRLTTRQKGWLMRETLTGLERRLPPGVFVRVHRAHLVRLAAIAELRRRRGGGEEVRMEDGQVLPAGRVHGRALRARLLGLRRQRPSR